MKFQTLKSKAVSRLKMPDGIKHKMWRRSSWYAGLHWCVSQDTWLYHQPPWAPTGAMGAKACIEKTIRCTAGLRRRLQGLRTRCAQGYCALRMRRCTHNADNQLGRGVSRRETRSWEFGVGPPHSFGPADPQRSPYENSLPPRHFV